MAHHERENEMTIAELAAEMNVTESQVANFVEMLRPRVEAGMSIEEAVADSRRAVALMTEQAFAKRRTLKAVMLDSGLYEDLRAA